MPVPQPPYPLGVWPKQLIGGGIARSKFTPNSVSPSVGKVGNQFNGGTIFAGGTLQNNNLFDNTFGVLAWPYLGIHNAYNDNKPSLSFNSPAYGGVQKALSSGKFSTMTAGQYIILTFTNQIAGVANTILRSPGATFTGGRKSENKNIGWWNTQIFYKDNAGGFFLYNGLPVGTYYTRDSLGTEPVSTWATPGRLTYWTGAPTAKLDGYKAKTD